MAAFLPPPLLGGLAATAARRLARTPLPPLSPTLRPAVTTATAPSTPSTSLGVAGSADGGAPAALEATPADTTFRPRTRRAVLAAAATVAAAAAAATATTAATAAAATAAVAAAPPPPQPLQASEEERRPPFVTLPSGVRVQEIAVGEGKVVTDGSVVSLQYVLRRPNGYFVDASYGFDRLDLYTYTAGSGGVVAGFDAAVRGMAPGGRRRFVVPPAVGYVGGVGGGKPGPIPPGWGERRALASHIGEDLIFEVRVVRVK